MRLNIPSKVKALKLFKGDNFQKSSDLEMILLLPANSYDIYIYIISIELSVCNWCWDIERKVIDGRLTKLENGVKLYAHGDFLAGA